MKKEILDALDSFPNVMKMLDSIPRQLWYIFLPDTIENLAMLEADILAQRKRDRERDKVMSVQKLCGFPLRPNERIRDVMARAKIQGLKNNSLLDKRSEDNSDSSKS
jgi:hypothetical protein